MAQARVSVSEEHHVEAERITKRIQSVTLARSLALAGRYEKAVELLEQTRDMYIGNPSLLENLDWLLKEYRQKIDAT
jgi:hypothetical protein